MMVDGGPWDPNTPWTGRWYKHPQRRCADNPELFEPPDGDRGGWTAARGKRRCVIGGGCPVLWQCLDDALELGDIWCVRAGMIGAPLGRIVTARRAEARGETSRHGSAAALLAKVERELLRRGVTRRRRVGTVAS